ncbi:MAG: hypothetical protein CM15mP83_7470 [Flavobacteriaceae bacterium]|nr:MAG: hypothetical protein CM15mP83_7470 [Flavobacteriaceae bacterium]
MWSMLVASKTMGDTEGVRMRTANRMARKYCRSQTQSQQFGGILCGFRACVAQLSQSQAQNGDF